MRFNYRFVCALGALFILLIQGASGQDWTTLNRQCIQLYQSGRYSEAIAVADQALGLANKQFGTTSTEYLNSLTNKAYAQSAHGYHQKSLSSFREAAVISFQLYSRPHAAQMQTLGELAKNFITLGVYDSAEHYLNLATSVYTSVQEKNKQHYDTATFLLIDSYIKNNALYASLHYRKGQVVEAIQLLEFQLSLLKQLYIEDYSEQADYKTTINNLAAYYNDLGNPEKAMQYSREYYALTDKADTLGRIYALQNMGGSNRNRNQLDSAHYYWQKASELAERSNYNGSFVHTMVLNNLGELYVQMERYNDAIVVLKKSLAIQRSKEAVQPEAHQTTLFNLAESYHWSGQYARADSVYTSLVEAVLDDILHNFTYLSDNEKISFFNRRSALIHDFASFAVGISALPVLQHSDKPYINPEIPGRLYDVQLTTKAIILNASRRMKHTILNSGDSVLINNYSLWEERKNKLARMLMDTRARTEELSQLQMKIEENEKWLKANSRSFQSGFEINRVSWKQVQQKLTDGEAAVEIVRLIDGLLYGALIVTPETKDQPVFSLVMSTRSKHLEKQFYQQYYNSILYKLDDTLSYNTYWKPIVDSIRQYMPSGMMPLRVYVSNDGVYNQINLNTLRNPATGQYVLDETDVVLLTNTKELLEYDNRKQGRDQKAALFGRPAFTLQDGGRQSFADLPGTGKEIALVKEALTKVNFKTHVFSGEQATEENLKTLDRVNILHLASHGFFTGRDEMQRSLAETMIRSGVALAGANDTLRSGEDGLLTAFEVIGLDLDSTNLVVLSACETGKGAINQGEGVYGLQRALRVAGARNIIMSLWKVDDAATQQLMVGFYRQWTATGDMRRSFRMAQQALRERYPSPYYWGAFILAGR